MNKFEQVFSDGHQTSLPGHRVSMILIDSLMFIIWTWFRLFVIMADVKFRNFQYTFLQHVFTKIPVFDILKNI